MKRRSLFLAPLLAATLALPAWAEPISLAELSRYFNDFTTARTEFTQINPDGTISTGTLYIHRPGRMRFEYDPPDDSLVMAGGGQVAIFDGKSNQGPTQYPLRRTPLNLILAPSVDLGRDRMVVAHRQEDNTTVVVAQDPENPEYGNIRLVFTAGPTELRQWRVTDDAGRETTVILGGLETGVALSSALFSITHEAEDRRQ
ncbi:LolA family protein [Alkalilacustris brevis]|uniref:LolA family protein n=1 Tax=Alkalilacustris brevis TaxID=2026338 RepID=UPI000E0D7BC8|nr:outer membrane lipoprotein carrier protein LolA [Alkalilacustris brevis]